MESYLIIEKWVAYFFIYCFIGWCFESTYVSIKSRRLVNRGFLRGPFLPIYGFGAITILLATLLEYVTGAIMESVFSMKYWDYSNQRFNIKGYICLSSSIAWGVFSVLLVKVVHVPVVRIVGNMNKTLLGVILLVVAAVTAVDFVFSFKNALDFRKILVYQAAVKKELAELSERISETREAFSEMANEKQREYFARQEERISALKLELDAVRFKAEKFSKSIIRSFPNSSSDRFGEALEDIKKKVLSRKNS